MSKSLSDLTDHLFAQLERMAQPGMSAEDIELEAERTRAIVQLADQVTKNAHTQLSAAKLFAENGQGILPMLPQIGKAAK